jgi:hypothetical protein
MMTEQDKQYAYGDWKVDSVSCPITSAGLEGKEYADTVATDFDDAVTAIVEDGDGEGVISRDNAKKAFEKIGEMYERRLNKSERHSNTNHSKLGIVKEVISEEFNQ